MRALAALIVTLILWAGAARAHPHAWIDVKSALVFDGTGKATAIVEEWLFDELYSVFVTDELGPDAANRPDALADLARRNLGNLREYGYFTEVRLDGSKLPTGDAADVATGMRDGRLWLRFTLPLARPADVGAGQFSYAIFDPTFFIAMAHGDTANATIDGRADCTAAVHPPAPDEEDVTLAAALDRRATADVSLGLAFAEWVVVTCR